MLGWPKGVREGLKTSFLPMSSPSPRQWRWESPSRGVLFCLLFLGGERLDCHPCQPLLHSATLTPCTQAGKAAKDLDSQRFFFSFPLKGARRHCGLHTLQELIPSWKQLHCSWRMPSVDTAVSSTSHSVELRGAANCDVFQRKQHGNCSQNPCTRMRCWGPARWCPQCPCCLPQLSTQSLPTTPTP